MKLGTDILGHWAELRAHLPADFDVEATARAREIKDADTLLRLALGYGACGMSLRETCAWAAAGGLAALLADQPGAAAASAGRWVGRWAGRRLRAVDATTLCEPGADRTTWRLHASYDLAAERTDRIELTDGRGAESFKRLTCRPGDILLGDRGYARPGATRGRAIFGRCWRQGPT